MSDARDATDATSDNGGRKRTLRDLRREAGMTQFALAVKAGVTIGLISRIEGGVPGGNMAKREAIAEALGKDLGEIAWPTKDEEEDAATDEQGGGGRGGRQRRTAHHKESHLSAASRIAHPGAVRRLAPLAVGALG